MQGNASWRKATTFMTARTDEVNDAVTSDRTSAGLLRKRELAEKLAISKRTLDIWMQKGRIPFLKVGRSVRFRLPDVLEKLQKYRVN
jgi:excisionase family DNA binding protein